MRVLIAGGNGFIGAWIARRLAAKGIALRIFDIAENRRVVAAIGGAEVAARAEWRVGDIVKGGDVLAAAEGCDGVINLAGILTPACKDDPVRGAEINLIGTLNVFEAARRHAIERLVYTSSAGVFGPIDGRQPFPTTHYGAFKLACEGSARAYWEDHGLASTGFRPYIVYGPGRETGLTAGPSLACRAAARGEAYTIPYRGSAGLVYVDDVAAAYELALLREADGAHVFNLVGAVACNDDVVAEIRRCVPSAQISVDGPVLSITPNVEEGDVRRALSGLPDTSLRDGIAASIEFYRRSQL